MVCKLPRHLTDRWGCEVDPWLNKEDEDQRYDKGHSSSYPPFSVFCRFLQRVSRIACNPVTTARTQKEETVKEDLKTRDGDQVVLKGKGWISTTFSD